MKLKYNTLLPPLAIATVITALIILFTRPGGEKFNIDFEYIKNGTNTSIFGAWDFFQDGTSETVELGIDKYNSQYLKVRDDGAQLTLWEEKIPGAEPPLLYHYMAFYHLPGDSLTTIAFLFHRHDSVFLGTYRAFSEQEYIQTFPVLKCNNPHGIENIQCSFFNALHFGVDSLPGILFTINTGWGYVPRKLYHFDPVNDTLYQSPESGAIKTEYYPADINSDGNNEYIIVTGCACNHDRPMPFPDTCCWIMVFNSDMSYFNEPIALPGRGAKKSAGRPKDSDIISICLNSTAFDSTKLIHYNIKKHSITAKNIQLDNNKNILIPVKNIKTNKILFANYNKPDLLLSDTGLSKINHIKTDKVNLRFISTKRFTQLNEPVYLFYHYPTNYIYIFDEKFKNFTKVPSQLNNINLESTQSIVKINGSEKLLINAMDKSAIISIEYSKRWELRYLIWIGIWVITALFITSIWHMAARQSKEKYEMKSMLDSYRILAIHNQLNPHFIFNILNTLAGTVYMEDKKRAHSYFGNFSKLLRITINTSDRIDRSLQDEIDFVENYLLLQSLRWQDKFTYKITIDPKTGHNKLTHPIPGLIIHTFTENALKHGILPSPREGKLSILIAGKGKNTQIVITDNGIGRQNASKRKNIIGTGQGLKLLQEKTILFNKVNRSNVTWEITDAFPGEKQFPGTKVTITIS